MPRTHSQAAQFLAVPLTTTVDVGGGDVSYDLETRVHVPGLHAAGDAAALETARRRIDLVSPPRKE